MSASVCSVPSDIDKAEGRSSSISSMSFITPCPTPRFFEEDAVFSTKKSREGTPRHTPPPRPPAKSCPPLSRVFYHKPVDTAQLVSFRNPKASGASISPLYDQQSEKSLFEQCFTVEKKLGFGSFGEVYKVKSKDDDKYYAVKRSRDSFKGEMDRRRKLEEVAKHEMLPHHPNCVRFVRAWEEKQHLYIQSELCDESLSHFAETNHEIPEKLIWNYLVDLLMAVKHLHDHDLIHMDIKPENIFLASDGTCKLGDFGLILDLRKESDLSEAQEGDPKYLAPELLEGKFTKAADIFSLGMTIFELASDLDLPRGGEGWHQLRHGKLPEEFIQGRISDRLKSIIKLMMEPDYTLRPSAAELMALASVRAHIALRQVDTFVRHQSMAVVGMFLVLWSFLVSLWQAVKSPFSADVPAPSHPPTPKKRRWSFSDGSSSPTRSSQVLRDTAFSDDDESDLFKGASSHGSSPPMKNESQYRVNADLPRPMVSPLSLRYRGAMTTGATAAARQTARFGGGSPLRMRDFGASPSSVTTRSACSAKATLCVAEPTTSPVAQPMLGTSSRSSVRKRLTGSLSRHPDDEIKINLEPRNLLGMFESASSGIE